MTDAQLWWEVLAVLAIGVVPYQINALVAAVDGLPPPLANWLDALDLVVRSACVTFAVMYIIHRSGEPMSSFGLVRPRLLDLGLALPLLVVDLGLIANFGRPLPLDGPPQPPLPAPEGAVAYALVIAKHAANGFAEELVMRAYLITRWKRLLRSRVQAVVLSAFLFASYHLHYGPGGGLVAIALLGLVNGGLYLMFPRIWPFALAHMGVNIILDLRG
jgi:membrane protease YdiL (CAAX protease family)